jgi:hypothetical protein
MIAVRAGFSSMAVSPWGVDSLMGCCRCRVVDHA